MTEESALVTADDGTFVHVVELIPGQEHLVLFAASTDELPGRDVVDELRMHAYERAGGDDLGLPDVASDALNLAQLVGEGVLANVAWEGLLATKRFVERRRGRPTGSAVSPASAEERARTAAATAGAASADAVVVSTVPEQNGWTVTLGLPDGSQVRVSLDPTATVASVEHDNTP
ncbi:hypothetical protein [Streptomyces sp. R08]|uniref:Uncharacterized protein n=1 Tax=Streptomyces sp. R08 TaxID=3238624 RepID=A0AB39MMC0_9ACTN